MGFGMTRGSVIRLAKSGPSAMLGYDVVLVAGQSNMAGRGVFSSSIDFYDTYVDQFDGNSASGTYQRIITGQDPLKQPEPSSTAVGPAVSFGKTYVPATGRKVLLVPAAWGGTGLVAGSPITWSPYGTNNRDYLNAISQANLAVAAAIARFPSSQFVGTIWLQGEADGTNGATQAAYRQALTDLIAGFRAGITGASNSWFIIGQMMPEAIVAQGGTMAMINAAHKEVAGSVVGCAWAAIGTGYNSGDNLHYNAAGERLMGVTQAGRVTDAIARTSSIVPGTVTSLSVTTTDVSASLSWDFPQTGGITTGFDLEYKETASGTWIPQTVTGLAVSATVSGLTASTSYDFRVRAKNAVGAGINATSTNSTAAATTFTNVRLTTLTGIIETGDGTAGWNYGASTGATFAANHAGVSSHKLPAGVDGGIQWTLSSTFHSGRAWLLGIVNTQTDPAYNTGASGYKYAVYPASTQYSLKQNGSATTVNPTTVVTPATGDVMRLRRTAGVWVAEVAPSATPTVFTQVYQFAAADNTDVWFAVSANSTTGTSIMNGPLVGLNVI